MLTPTTKEVPPQSIQIRPSEPWGDDKTADIVSKVRERFEIRENELLREGFQEVGGGGAPSEVYVIIQSAAGTAGILLLQKVYRYIRENYAVDEGEHDETDGAVIHIEQIHINLSDELRTSEECRKEMDDPNNKKLEIDPAQRSVSDFKEIEE